MIKKALLNCTITLVKILISQYEAGIISFNDFLTSTKLKKDFLEANLADFENFDERLTAEKIISQLDNIYINSLASLSYSDRNPNASSLF